MEIINIMDAETTADQLAGPINDFGARFMLDPATFARSVEMGLPPSLASYVQGRLGVMGDIDVEVAIEYMFFFDRHMVAKAWAEPCSLSKTEAGAAYASICAERGRVYLEGFSGADQMAELLEQVANAADDTDAALFAGWRDAYRPADPPGRAYLLLATVRELRGCLHMSVCRKAGVDALSMVLAQGGEGTAKLHGYQNLEREPASVAEIASIEAVTGKADATNFTCLSEHNRSELVALVRAAVAHASER